MKKHLGDAEIREFAEEFAKFNISVKMPDGKYKTFETVMDEILEIWTRLNSVQKEYLAEIILSQEE